ncbi:MAG: hypothetical protein ACLUEQ_04825 [Cloacibacillus evryensis]
MRRRETRRNYYTEFVEKSPADTITHARLRQVPLQRPRPRYDRRLPAHHGHGDSNDAYSAIRVAVALSEAFKCGVNDLPLTLVLSWYEQKAVCILLTLLHLGIKNILLGPTLPAFVSPNVLNFLVEHYNIAPIGTPEADLKKILG